MKSLHVAASACLASAAFVVGSASAGFTKVDGPTGNEPTQSEILSEIYGGNFAGNGESYSNGQLTAVRVNDSDAATTDQTWKPGKYTVRSVAKFTSEESRFYASNPSTPQLHTVKVGYGTTDPVTVNAPQDFYWTATNYYGTSSTQVDLNSDAKDHFVTYEIQSETSNSTAPRYVLFWEDLPQTRNVTKTEASWSDFNDLVVEVQAATPGGAVIPLPPAAYASLVTVAIFGAAHLLRNRARRAF